jgi:hypothetical protein
MVHSSKIATMAAVVMTASLVATSAFAASTHGAANRRALRLSRRPTATVQIQPKAAVQIFKVLPAKDAETHSLGGYTVDPVPAVTTDTSGTATASFGTVQPATTPAPAVSDESAPKPTEATGPRFVQNVHEAVLAEVREQLAVDNSETGPYNLDLDHTDGKEYPINSSLNIARNDNCQMSEAQRQPFYTQVMMYELSRLGTDAPSWTHLNFNGGAQYDIFDASTLADGLSCAPVDAPRFAQNVHLAVLAEVREQLAVDNSETGPYNLDLDHTDGKEYPINSSLNIARNDNCQMSEAQRQPFYTQVMMYLISRLGQTTPTWTHLDFNGNGTYDIFDASTLADGLNCSQPR